MEQIIKEIDWNRILMLCKKKLWKYNASMDEKEDALSNAICELLCTGCKAVSFCDEHHLCNYLLLATKHNLFDEQRRRRKYTDSIKFESEEDQSGEVTQFEMPTQNSDMCLSISIDFTNAMENLSKNNAEVFTLMIHGFTAKEIANSTGESSENIAKKIQRTRTLLQRKLHMYNNAA